MYGNNLDEVISGYRELTGNATMLPKWAMGFWQSRERYKTQNELLSVVKEFRERKKKFIFKNRTKDRIKYFVDKIRL